MLFSVFELGLKVIDPNFRLELRLYNQYVDQVDIEMYNLFIGGKITGYTSCNQYRSCILRNDEVLMEQFCII